ncbi:TPA: hypothetical protein VDV07_000207 [Pseudomonas aeruginosa]|nr:hypothetical protein [Pseudomonas aeruginosa]
MMDRSAGCKPAPAYHTLTPLYDRVVALTVREQRFKPALVAQASIRAAETRYFIPAFGILSLYRALKEAP